MRTKICTKCGLEKPTSEFNKNKLKKDGLQSVGCSHWKSPLLKFKINKVRKRGSL